MSFDKQHASTLPTNDQRLYHSMLDSLSCPQNNFAPLLAPSIEPHQQKAEARLRRRKVFCECGKAASSAAREIAKGLKSFDGTPWIASRERPKTGKARIACQERTRAHHSIGVGLKKRALNTRFLADAPAKGKAHAAQIFHQPTSRSAAQRARLSAIESPTTASC
jgi:hypothetical protein